MSRFLTPARGKLIPYTPGEQPRDMEYIKLNTNESPFPPLPEVMEAARKAAGEGNLYPDPRCMDLREAIAEALDVTPEEVTVGNGSDEILNFAFLAFCDGNHPALFPDVTYGFYPVFADLNGIPYRTIPLEEDFTVDPGRYAGVEGTIFLANPNAPTGLALTPEAVEGILRNNPDRVLVLDEAYVDFGAETCVPLVRRYENLLVTRTFSKSRSMAGARLGFAVGSPALIGDLETIRYSTNPYNLDRATMASGIASLRRDEYNLENCRTVARVREEVRSELDGMGFETTSSKANFLFARHPRLEGGALYRALRRRGILVRHFDVPRISDYNRITVGTRVQMDALVAALREILTECETDEKR